MAADCNGVDGEVLLLSQFLDLCQYQTVAGVTSPISDQIQTHSISKAAACLEQRHMTHSHTCAEKRAKQAVLKQKRLHSDKQENNKNQ